MKLLCPQVVQTSAMDCGPAALKAALAGFGVDVSYHSLRARCRTEVDGTSIDTLEEVATELGLEAEQLVLPPEHVLSADAGTLPAIAIVRLPNGFSHFVVLWRTLGPYVQVMDPSSGRHWVRKSALIRRLYIHTLSVDARVWTRWADHNRFRPTLAARLRALGLADPDAASLLGDADWRRMASLDAAARSVEELIEAGAVRRGPHARRLFRALSACASAGSVDVIPEAQWCVRSAPDDGAEQKVTMRGAVLLRLRPPKISAASDATDSRPAKTAAGTPAALRTLLDIMRADGTLSLTLVVGAILAAAAATTLEALLFRGLVGLGARLPSSQLRATGVVALGILLVALFALDLATLLSVAAVGRRLELRLRIAFLLKIPRLGIQYFSTRSRPDIAERAHVVETVRSFPQIGHALVAAAAELAMTAAALVWLVPRCSAVIAFGVAIAVTIPLVAHGPLTERELRARIHDSTMKQFYLDALLGLVAIRSHGAERAARREHEALVVEWAAASRAFARSL